MSTIEGIEIPDDAIAEAAAVADALDAAIPGIMALLDRATAAMTAVELPSLRQTGWNRTDEQREALYSQTALQRLDDHFAALNDRTDDMKMFAPEYYSEDPARVS